MGLGCRWLVNLALLAIPIATTIGILLGLQGHRKAAGKPPLFIDNRVTHREYCQKAYGITPEAVGQEFTLNPNQWGWDEGEPGSLCMNITSFNNNTYPTRTTAPEFSVTWQYPPGPETAPVHAFPNIKVDSAAFPATLTSLKHLKVDLEWTYGVGEDAADSTSLQDLTSNQVNTNVAIDMFFDSDGAKAKDATKAAYEIMVWLSAFGVATQPIGLAKGAEAVEKLGGHTFSLYTGENSLNQRVLTWVASDPIEKFHGDLTPLVERLVAMPGPGFPDGNDYLGYMGLGSETLSCKEPVTFHVPMLSIDVQTGTK